jgi:DNA polymerase (family 10)
MLLSFLLTLNTDVICANLFDWIGTAGLLEMKYETAKLMSDFIKDNISLFDGAKKIHCLIKVVGSVRRKAKEVYDLDFLLICDEVPVDTIIDIDNVVVEKVLKQGKTHQSFDISCHIGSIQCDFFICSKAEKAYALYHYTGSKDYNIRTRAHAKARNLLLNQHGLFSRTTNKRIKNTLFTTEKEITQYLGLSYRSPSNRS